MGHTYDFLNLSDDCLDRLILENDEDRDFYIQCKAFLNRHPLYNDRHPYAFRFSTEEPRDEGEKYAALFYLDPCSEPTRYSLLECKWYTDVVLKIRDTNGTIIRTLGMRLLRDFRYRGESPYDAKTALPLLKEYFKSMKARFINIFGDPHPTTEFEDWIRALPSFYYIQKPPNTIEIIAF